MAGKKKVFVATAAEVADLKLKVEQLGQDFELMRAEAITSDKLQGVLKEQFGKHNAAVMGLLDEWAKKEGEKIDQRIIEGVTKGIGAYDKMAIEKYATKGDLAATPNSQGGQGGQRAQQGGSAGGFDFMGTLFKVVERAVTNGGGSTDDWMLSEVANFRKLYDNDMRLKFRSFLRKEYSAGEVPGHVEVSK